MIPDVTHAYQLLHLDKPNPNFQSDWDMLPDEYKTGKACVITESVLLVRTPFVNNADWKY